MMRVDHERTLAYVQMGFCIKGHMHICTTGHIYISALVLGYEILQRLDHEGRHVGTPL